MTRDDIIRMAKEAGAAMLLHGESCLMGDVSIDRFANIIAAAEREACLKEIAIELDEWNYGTNANIALNNVDAAIRARSLK